MRDKAVRRARTNISSLGKSLLELDLPSEALSYVRREDVTGKKAITPDGNSFGVVKDLAFSTDGSVGLVITRKDDSETVVPIRQTSAIGEFILLSAKPMEKAPAPPVPQPMAAPNPSSTCPSCGKPVKPGAKFCGKCGYKLA